MSDVVRSMDFKPPSLGDLFSSPSTAGRSAYGIGLGLQFLVPQHQIVLSLHFEL